MNGGHYTAFVRLDSGTDIDFDEIHNHPLEALDKVLSPPSSVVGVSLLLERYPINAQ